MSELDVVIGGGTVVTAADTLRVDGRIQGGKIVAVAERLADGAKVIDAGGSLMMPGGIDSHVHLAQPLGDAVMADGFESGTRSAVAGGTQP